MARRRMIAHIHYHYVRNGHNYDIEMDVDLSRFNRQYGRAQWLLDNQVMTDMEPFMPKETNTFINVTRGLSAAIAGSGKVYAAAPPFGHYLYEGKTMVDITTGSPWARRGAKKVYVSQFSRRTNAKERLEYFEGEHPRVTSHWFDAAKRAYGTRWIRRARQIAGGGARD